MEGVGSCMIGAGAFVCHYKRCIRIYLVLKYPSGLKASGLGSEKQLWQQPGSAAGSRAIGVLGVPAIKPLKSRTRIKPRPYSARHCLKHLGRQGTSK